MAKAIVRVDVRSPSKLLAVLEAERDQRCTHGELGFSFCIDDAKRNIGHVILEWKSFHSLENFLDSSVAREMLRTWPVVEVLDVLRLRDISQELKDAKG